MVGLLAGSLRANQSAENNALSQKNRLNYRTRIMIYYRDGTVTLWDMSNQAWVRTANPSDQLLDSLPRVEDERIRRYLQNGVS